MLSLLVFPGFSVQEMVLLKRLDGPGGFSALRARVVTGLIGTDPPDLTLESASPAPPWGAIWHRFNIDSTSISWLIRHRFPDLTLFRCQIDTWGGEGDGDSKVGFGGPVPTEAPDKARVPEWLLNLGGLRVSNNPDLLFLAFWERQGESPTENSFLFLPRTNVQQLTCKMVWSSSFYYLLLSFLIFELKQQ